MSVFRAVLIYAVFFAGALHATCEETRVDLRWDGGSVAFDVDVADDFAERSQGLMFVEEMARSKGMLFVYNRPQRVAFWMRNTLIPLDMLFFDEMGVLQKIHVNAVPLDETAIPGGDDIQYVLEINGGLSDLFAIPEGA
ncbi:MAG: DUF192 domain-containing protein, partial [Pseudomonadota bacterium]